MNRSITEVSILGTIYHIKYDVTEKQDSMIEDCRGYTDETSKSLVIGKEGSDCDCENIEYLKNKTLRHEIIHAFLIESGLDNNSFTVNEPWAHNEEMVDWIARQFSKIQKVYEFLGIAE